MNKDFAQYRVSLKVLLKRGDSYLFLRDAVRGFLDFPGGRIDAAERETPLSEILNREIIEEIGAKARYQIGGPIFQYRAAENEPNVFITVYAADYLSGEITLSPEHNEIIWLNPKTFDFQKEKFVSNEGYIALKNYFAKSI